MLNTHLSNISPAPVTRAELGSKNSFTGYIRAVFGEDWLFLKIIFLGVAVWFLIAGFSMYLMPNTPTTTGENSSQYIKYVLRDGQFYLTFMLVIIPIKFLGEAKRTSQDQSIFLHFHIQARQWLNGSKKEILGIPAYFALGVAVFTVYLYSYSTLKTRVPEFNPFKWDEIFMKMDNVLFLGKDPWQYFAFLYNYPKLIAAMDFVYDFWAVILVSTWFYSLRFGGKHKARRYQFVLALMLTWFIGGNILATMFSTAGPVYFEALTGMPSTFPDQMAALSAINAQTPLRAFEYQAFLWDVYQSPGLGLGGIAAMPSMHNASALLLYLMFGRTPTTRVLFGAFCLLIFISSFVLAWHYAVDGLFAVPVTIGCWKLAGWVVNKAGVTNT